MTTTPVGMRCPECARQKTQVKTLRNTARRPEVTIALIAINVVVFLTEGSFTFSGGPTGKVYEEGALFGSLSGLPTLGVAHGQWWRIVTSGFMHENLIHIGFNMYVLYILGQMLEPALGRLKFGTIYAVSLLCGSFGALLVTPHSPTVGASGAVFGLMGAAAVEMRARQIPVMQSGVGGLILLNLVISFALPGHLLGRAHRRPDRRGDGGARAPARRPPPLAGARAGWLRGDRRGRVRGIDRGLEGDRSRNDGPHPADRTRSVTRRRALTAAR